MSKIVDINNISKLFRQDFITKNVKLDSEKVMLTNETFVRAFEAYYILETQGNQSAERFIENQESIGFYLVGRIYQAYLTDYLPNRGKYPTFESFMPELARLIDIWYREGFWRNVSLEPTIRMAFVAFKTKGVKVYSPNLSESSYVKSYVNMLEKGGFEVTFTEGPGSGNLIVIAPLSSPVVSRLNRYVEIRGNSVVLNGVKHSNGVFIVEALNNPAGEGYVLLIAGSPDVFKRKPSRGGNENLLNYHYFVYITSLKRVVAFG
ncbi:DUF4932 domain-containing protein [Thermococcus sp.]|uniref:DUF4932 domain-containing protein n=1 Tax=Thermococcus sp. TaxID=35749 RepID=UPI0026319F17|nr:DUF4932 domain-containing protein [Thermococcus sp.]